MRIFFLFSLIICMFCLAPAGFSDQQLEGRKHPLTQAEQDLMKQVKISFDEAKKIALKKEPGTIFNWELEKENGRVIYSIEIQLPNDKKQSREVNVDANTGKIVGIEKENLAKQLKASGEND